VGVKGWPKGDYELERLPEDRLGHDGSVPDAILVREFPNIEQNEDDILQETIQEKHCKNKRCEESPLRGRKTVTPLTKTHKKSCPSLKRRRSSLFRNPLDLSNIQFGRSG